MVVQGVLIGIAIAAPVGPNALLCIARAAEHGGRVGFMSGLGSATGHALYSILALVGLSRLTSPTVRLFGGVLLVLLGARLAFGRRSPRVAKAHPTRARIYGSALAIALGNPMTVAAIGALFTTSGARAHDLAPALLLVAGVFLGSALWWGVLSTVVAGCCWRLTMRARRWIDQVAAAAMAGMGLLTVGGV